MAYHIQLNAHEFMGGVKFLVANQMSFKHATTQREAYVFWKKEYAENVVPSIIGKFPKAKVIKSEIYKP